jgi:hypothetical protein
VSASEAVLFGGAYNVIKNGFWKLISNPLQFGNNPDNPPHIRDGADQFNQGILGVKYSENSTTGPDGQQTATNFDVDRNNHAVESAVPVLTRIGKHIGDSLMPTAQAAPLRGPLSPSPAPNLPSDETQGTVSNQPERRLGRRIVNPSPASASHATVPAMPFVPSNEVLSPDDRASFSDRFGNWTSSPDDITRRNPNLPVPPPEPGRPLGIFSGKPMPLWTTPPPLGGLLDNSSAAGNDDRNWFTALAGNSFSRTGGSGDTRSSPTPEPQQSHGPAPPYIQEYLQYLNQLNGNHPRASAFDPSVPAAPFDVSDPTPFSGGLPGRLAAVAGIDPQNPNQFAPPPLDDEQQQADLRALDARLSSSGDIRDAVALYNARKSSRR